MNEQRIERALRGGPPFAVQYRAAPLRLESRPMPRRAELRSVAVLAVLAAIVVAGVALAPLIVRGPGTAAPATLQELNGPIQPAPLIVPTDLRAEIERICRRDPDMPPGALTVMVDARGGGIAYVWIYSQDDTRRLWSCLVESLDPVTSMEGGVGGPYPNAVDPGELRWADTQFTSLLGYAGPGIDSVRIAVDDGPTVTATRNGVWFAAYWAPPAACPIVGQSRVCPDVHYRAIALDASGEVVKEIDWYSPADAPPGWTSPPTGADE